ncbi:MAG: hypothetical protein B7Z55_06630 [Planctomycetales bacterium 12-60-4]|nr:MAG: hypothetical protein B7Z55_06630 [Planctomycetales bacterium 12-60-4]
MSRREKLESMLVAEPDDVFLHYALATELLKQGEATLAEEKFAQIHAQFPDYVPAWFRHAQAAQEQGRTDDARTIGEQGLATARRVGDHHAAGEIAGFLDLLS